jgi:putative restriction endonuclease
MNTTRTNWSREEMLVAFNLYCKIPFGQIHIRNPKIIRLAEFLKRTPSAVSWKLANFARFDETLKSRNIKGASHGSKLEKEIWDNYKADPEQIIFESEKLLREKNIDSFEDQSNASLKERNFVGEDVERNVKTRINQNFFRAMVLATYENACWISGIDNNKLLIASHIIPWASNKNERLNPKNGICLNALFDKAFDSGLLTITPDYKVKLSDNLSHGPVSDFFGRYNGKRLEAPHRFAPNPEFLEYHNKCIFGKQKVNTNALSG